MRVVVGLGNPGSKYRRTRHNIGFEVLACLAGRHQASKPKVRFEAEVAEALIAGKKTLLVAPQTYMNLSGRAVRRLVDFYQLPLDDLLVVCDDINLDLARIRCRRSGSSGGQKGLEDVIHRLGSGEFARLRIGIGSPPARMQAEDYVLGRFGKEDAEKIQQTIQVAADGVELWVDQGIDATMNRYNAPLPD